MDLIFRAEKHYVSLLPSSPTILAGRPLLTTLLPTRWPDARPSGQRTVALATVLTSRAWDGQTGLVRPRPLLGPSPCRSRARAGLARTRRHAPTAISASGFGRARSPWPAWPAHACPIRCPGGGVGVGGKRRPAPSQGSQGNFEAQSAAFYHRPRPVFQRMFKTVIKPIDR